VFEIHRTLVVRSMENKTGEGESQWEGDKYMAVKGTIKIT
jgi:hypothetical protein